MDKSSVYYLWDVKFLPWLYRHHQAGDHISIDDLHRILRAEPDAISDPLMQDYLRRSVRGELRPRRGRRKLGRARQLCLIVADLEISERAEEIRRLRRFRKTPRCRSDLSPLMQAAEEVAADWGYSLGCGRSVLNQISAHRNSRPNVVNENSLWA
jgi:hypothetical protein